MKNIYSYWGKASPKKIEEGAKYHPAICHMLDVALVAQVLLERLDKLEIPLKQLLFSPLTCPKTQQIDWLAFIIALHDIGKISPGFQRKVPELCDFHDATLPFSRDPTEDEGNHGKVSYVALTDLLVDKAACEYDIAELLAHAVGAHHGKFYPVPETKNIGQAQWSTERSDIVEALREVFVLEWEDFPFPDDTLSAQFILALSGLTAVADWLGSNEADFRYVGTCTDTLEVYKKQRLPIAQRIVDTLHLQHFKLQAAIPAFEELFKFPPNTCQTHSLNIAQQLQGASLLLIETPMGSGKTEAALAAADLWMRKQQAAGIYYALPTQATANQMFGRIKSFLANYTADNNALELHLLHAYAALHEGYQELQSAAIYDPDEPKHPDKAAIQASEWFTGAKRGLLSSFAVGSVDQALLSAMRTKHMFVRLFGLAGKVVIIDEVHAYDAYTSQLLERLISWLAQLNTSVILLSATLPAKKRQALLEAYQPQAKFDEMPHYPCVMGVDQQGKVIAQSLSWLEKDQRNFQLKLLPKTKAEPWQAVRTLLAESLQDGGCAACIVNTVMEAQALFKSIEKDAAFADTLLILFHARFPIGERLEIEKQLENLFGKPEKSAGKRPKKAIVVATQVLEQSLDVDFDLMFSDIAPIDLLLQRAGRLQRHQRQRPKLFEQNAVLYCLQPDLSVAEPDFGMTGKIYAPILLQKTALVLEKPANQKILLPGKATDENGVENLISQVYDADIPITSLPHLEALLENDAFHNKLKTHQERSAAIQRLLPKPCADATEFFEDMHNDYTGDDDNTLEALTRLAPPSVSLIVLHKINEQLYLDANAQQSVSFQGNEKLNRTITQQLLHRTVRISNSDWVKYFQENSKMPTSWQKTPMLRYCYPAIFQDGELHTEAGILRISEAYGLELTNNNQWDV